MIFGAIVAGGIGSRMNSSDIPKQFLTLGKDKKPILIHTLEKFLLCKKLDYVYLGIHKDWIDYTKNLLKKYNLDNNNEKIFISEGGPNRNLTIINIINLIEKNHGEDVNHIIVTHDAVRPFVTLRMIEENIEAVLKFGACDTVIPAVDTIIETQDQEFISSVPNRSSLYQGQTPQSFKITEFKNLYNNLSESEKNSLTDACKVFVFNKKNVKLVPGETFNIKITTINDYKIANNIINLDNKNNFAGGDMVD